MAEDWSANVLKYVPDADAGVIKAIVRYCGIALQKRDSSLVSFSDPKETARVRDNFLKKKLGLTHSDEKLDEAIAAVGVRMKGENFKNRVTVYYLLADHFGMLTLFGAAAKAAGSAAGAAAAAGAGALGLAAIGVDGAAAAVAPRPSPPPAAAPPAPAPSAAPAAAKTFSGQTAQDEDTGGGMGWWPWLLLALLVAALVWYLWGNRDQTGDDGAGSGAEVSAPAVGPSATGTESATPEATAAAAVAIPAGAGVVSGERDGKPMVTVYFDTGKTMVAPAFGAAATGLQSYLGANAGSTLAVSGFSDPSGNAAANAALSKKRAQAVKAALVGAGVADASVALVKPDAAIDATTTAENARRVEVTVK
jgi:outer membrane protein OmpA-like peptidoglycan-associated protein